MSESTILPTISSFECCVWLEILDTVDKLTEELVILKQENKASQRQIERLTEKNNILTDEIAGYEEKGLTVEELQSEKQQLVDELDNVKQQVG